MYQMTLTPNRTTQRLFARLTSYRRNGRRVDRVLVSYNRHGKVDRTKSIPINQESKDWSREAAGQRQRAYELRDRAIAPMMKRAADVVTDAYMATEKDQPLTAFSSLEENSIQVTPTAKRDWLIAMGAIKPARAIEKPDHADDLGRYANSHGADLWWDPIMFHCEATMSIARPAPPASVTDEWSY